MGLGELEASMNKQRQKYDEEFKKNAVKLSHASPKSVAEIAEDLGTHPNLLCRWCQRFTSNGDKLGYLSPRDYLKALEREELLAGT